MSEIALDFGLDRNRRQNYRISIPWLRNAIQEILEELSLVIHNCEDERSRRIVLHSRDRKDEGF